MLLWKSKILQHSVLIYIPYQLSWLIIVHTLHAIISYCYYRSLINVPMVIIILYSDSDNTVSDILTHQCYLFLIHCNISMVTKSDLYSIPNLVNCIYVLLWWINIITTHSNTNLLLQLLYLLDWLHIMKHYYGNHMCMWFTSLLISWFLLTYQKLVSNCPW